MEGEEGAVGGVKVVWDADGNDCSSMGGVGGCCNVVFECL